MRHYTRSIFLFVSMLFVISVTTTSLATTTQTQTQTQVHHKKPAVKKPLAHKTTTPKNKTTTKVATHKPVAKKHLAKTTPRRKAVALRESPLPSGNLQSGITQLLTTAPHNVHIGIIVQSMDTHQVLYQYNSDQLFAPASVQKLFVAVPALAFLKPNYQFKTRLLTTGSVNQGVLNGDLYVQFTGDPMLKKKQLLALFSQLKTNFIHKINGHIYIDNTTYDNIPYPPGWFWDDLIYEYAAPTDAIILDENRFSLIVTPLRRNAGSGVQLSSNLPVGVVKLQGNVQHGRHCGLNIHSDMNNRYLVNGCLPANAGPQYRGLALRNPILYAQALIQEGLRNNQVSFSGPIDIQQAPNTAQEVASNDSPCLQLIIKKMLKKSDNLITSAILKQLGANYYHSQGTWYQGISAIHNLLGPTAGINFSQVILADGPGLSRYNLIAPRQLMNLLYYAYHQDQIRPPLMDALPIAGVDGTLRYRMGKTNGQNRVHAKTGSMHGVSSLAGYVTTVHNGTLGFVIMVNGFVGPQYQARHFEDRVCEYLVQAAHP